MSKTTMTAAFAVLLLATPMAFAQTSTTTTTSPPATVTTSTTHAGTTNHIMPGQIRATQMDGSRVYDKQNQNIGDIKDMIVDRDGKIAAVVLDVGSFLGMGGKYVAVGLNDIKVSFDNNNKPKFVVDMTKDQLKAAQAYDLNPPNRNTGSTNPPANNTNR